MVPELFYTALMVRDFLKFLKVLMPGWRTGPWCAKSSLTCQALCLKDSGSWLHSGIRSSLVFKGADSIWHHSTSFVCLASWRLLGISAATIICLTNCHAPPCSRLVYASSSALSTKLSRSSHPASPVLRLELPGAISVCGQAQLLLEQRSPLQISLLCLSCRSGGSICSFLVP